MIKFRRDSVNFLLLVGSSFDRPSRTSACGEFDWFLIDFNFDISRIRFKLCLSKIFSNTFRPSYSFRAILKLHRLYFLHNSPVVRIKTIMPALLMNRIKVISKILAFHPILVVSLNNLYQLNLKLFSPLFDHFSSQWLSS